jgi:L-amino acid N-acyltransferase YncA
VIRPATLAEVRARCDALFCESAAETGVTGEVQWDLFESMDEAGALVLLVVDLDGEIVGYCCAAVSRELFSADTSCTTLSVFILQPHRGHTLGLLRALVEEADRRGAHVVRFQAVAGSDFERMLDRWRSALTRTGATFEMRR